MVISLRPSAMCRLVGSVLDLHGSCCSHAGAVRSGLLSHVAASSPEKSLLKAGEEMITVSK